MKKVFSFVILMLITVVVFACSSEPAQFKLTVEKVGEGEITITPKNEIYEEGAEVTISASPSEGWKFSQWEGDLTGSENPVSVKMDADKTITAKFVEAEAVTLVVNTEGFGSVVVTPEKEVYYEGDSVTLEAQTFSTVSVFTKWEGGTIANSTNSTETITLEGNTTITAIFDLSDEVTFYEDFEENDGTWSTKHTYGLKPEDSADKKPFVQQNTVYDGDWAAQFGDIGDSESSSFEKTVNLANDSYLFFSYSVSSSAYDKLFFYIDGDGENDIKLEKAGGIDWAMYEGELSSGEHTLKWMYKKDMSGEKRQDTAWIDNIIISNGVPKYKLDINITGYGSVVKKLDSGISQDFMYEEGTHITLEAVPGPGESFTTWGGADVPAGHLTDSTIDVVMGTSGITIDASFTGTLPAIEWLIMMYIGGDCNLETQLWSDLNEMEFGLNTLDEDVRSKVKIVALWDGIDGESDHPPIGARLYELGPDPAANNTISAETTDLTASKWWDGDEIDMSDGDNLKEFLNWAKGKYPDYGYSMLVMSDHGGGPRNRDGKPQRGAVWDYTSGGSEFVLETKEITQAITDAGFTGDNKLSILGFDACLMASVEEAYEHRTVAEYYVASLHTEQGDGWEYDHWIPQLTKRMIPMELGTVLVKSYYTNFNHAASQTLSCTDLSKMDALKIAIDELGGAIKDDDLLSIAVRAKFEDSTEFRGSWSYLYEVGDFVSRLSSSTVSVKAKAVADAMKAAIVYSWAGNSKGNYYGTGHETGRGLHLMGMLRPDIPDEFVFTYGEDIFSFADGDWAALHNKWYP